VEQWNDLVVLVALFLACQGKIAKRSIMPTVISRLLMQ
jgi:hypothetical protein